MCPGCQDGRSSGERGPAGSPCFPKRMPDTAGLPWASRLKVPGPRLGLYRFPWKFVLEEASWSGRGSGVGDCPRRRACCYKHCSCLQSDSLGCCLEGAPLGQNGVALVWAGCSTVSLKVSACPGESKGWISSVFRNGRGG